MRLCQGLGVGKGGQACSVSCFSHTLACEQPHRGARDLRPCSHLGPSPWAQHQPQNGEATILRHLQTVLPWPRAIRSCVLDRKTMSTELGLEPCPPSLLPGVQVSLTQWQPGALHRRGCSHSVK